MRQRRQILYAPSAEIVKLSKAGQLKQLDTAVFDLEDGVSPLKKDVARKNIVSFLQTKPQIIPELAIRINSISSRDGMRDLNEVILDPVVGKRIDALILPKAEEVDEIKFVDRWLDLNNFGHARLLALIETPLGLTNAAKICAASKRLDGLIFGAEDFRSAAGIAHKAGETAILYARSALVTAARSYGLQAIDMTSLDFRNPEVVLREAVGSKQLGFTGKQVIHPMQIDCVNKAWTPDAEEVKRLLKLVGDFVRTFYVDGKGVVDNQGVMVELPHITDAIRALMLGGKTSDEIQSYMDEICPRK
jgi:citrate lyase subunit beta-like protein